MDTSQIRPGAVTRHASLIVCEVIFLVSAVLALVSGDLIRAVIPTGLFLACFPPLVVEPWAKVRIPASLQLSYAVLLLGGPYLGSHLDFYAVWPPWDTVVHFYSGVPIAFGAIFAWGLAAHRYRFRAPAWLEATAIVSFGTFIGVLWEVCEFASDILIGTIAQESNFDTMTDLIGNMLSPIIIAAVLVLYRHRGWFRYIGFLLEADRHSVDPSPSRR